MLQHLHALRQQPNAAIALANQAGSKTCCTSSADFLDLSEQRGKGGSGEIERQAAHLKCRGQLAGNSGQPHQQGPGAEAAPSCASPPPFPTHCISEMCDQVASRAYACLMKAAFGQTASSPDFSLLMPGQVF